MKTIACVSRPIYRRSTRTAVNSSHWRSQAVPLQSSPFRRHFQCARRLNKEESNEAKAPADQISQNNAHKFWDEFRESYNVHPPTFPFEDQVPKHLVGTQITTTGFLTKVVVLSKALTFAHIRRDNGSVGIQILSKAPELTAKIKAIPLNSAVSVTGILVEKQKPKTPSKTGSSKANQSMLNSDGQSERSVLLNQLEVVVEDVICLNSFDDNIASGADIVQKLEDRHLQIRFDPKLREVLLFRSKVAGYTRNLLLKDFHEIETPVLFKSTPEGAREFLVPTRKPGFAYALPQSPQQYKQILMASGINNYFQFARCFRDEDLRADRQPEFTQIDLEMSWVGGDKVMQRVEMLIKSLYAELAKPGEWLRPLPDAPFYRMTYEEAMSSHGSDKPDLRIPGMIQSVEHIIPEELRKMLTHLENPIIEAFKFRLDGGSERAQNFARQFFSTYGDEFAKNPAGGPGVCIFNSRRPVDGLQTLGFEGAENLKHLYSQLPKQSFHSSEAHEVETTLDDGDVIILQARENLPHSGGSTPLGKLRLAMYNAAMADNLVEPDELHRYLWVTDFPMFTLEDGVDPGQGGTAGFSATHHPFTAPKTAEDVDLLSTDPLKAKADHYDLVVNGVELGGGSRRIHNAKMQRFIMEDVLKMSDKRINDFSHLLKALSAGCPPHAGLAIGFDRLIAVMSGTESIRDVIAFPKNSKGDDLLVKSPRKITEDEWERYHLQVRATPLVDGAAEFQKSADVDVNALPTASANKL